MQKSESLEKKLADLKQEEDRLRKQILKQKRHEEGELIKQIGKFALKRFYTLKSYKEFEDFFNSISVPPEKKIEKTDEENSEKDFKESNTSVAKKTDVNVTRSQSKISKSDDEKSQTIDEKSEVDISAFGKIETPIFDSRPTARSY